MKSYIISFYAICICMPLAHADSLGAADALKQLIEREGKVKMEATTQETSAHHTETSLHSKGQDNLKPNETLDGFIKRNYPGLPSKEVWVRRVFVEVNPTAFIDGNPNLMRPGGKLNLPSNAALRQSFKVAHPEIAKLFEETSNQASAKQWGASGDPSKQPKWVRYP